MACSSKDSGEAIVNNKIPNLIIALLTACFSFSLAAQPNSSAWFGLQLPAGIGDPHAASVDVSSANPIAAAIPRGEEGFTQLQGDTLFAYVGEIVQFSRQSRADGNRVWGRVTGFESARRTIDWTAQQFRDAGLVNIEVQDYASNGEMWWANDWQVTLLADDAFGPGSRNIVLESSLPTGDSFIEQDSIIATVIDTGHIDAAIPDIDINGKIAVQRLNPLTGAYSERTATRERAQQLMALGAVAVINVVEQLGNMHTRDFSRCNGPCFNIGTADGEFLLDAVKRAQQAGLEQELQLQLSLDASNLTGLSGQNVLGIVPGVNGLQGENIVVNAHVDGWYDAAGDNADGLAVLVAMARHFAQHPPQRTIIFVGSGGHHSSGLNGPSNLVRMNPQLLGSTILVLNLEHIAQLEIDSSDWSVGPKEQPMSFSITNAAPFLTTLTHAAMARYGFNLNPQFRTSAPGDLGGYRSLGLPMIQAIHSGPLYHASGDVLETISVPGLERAARFYTYFIDQIAMADKALIDP
ncbi:MAG: hypothetical protein COC19_03985 [SAR86 cluster bacterium]|uniref:Peptidase M28 domain-containing protein n=1 Tax=SAR86 cluster bacterium TaxID=2030880 RepID=A0A2A4MP79_9GAMM|nr:MAG: hypothetical protein COC19_03985 [SAR86 cluster bacterium]